MAGKSKKEMHPFMERLMKQLDCANLAEMEQKTGIPYTTLFGYAHKGAIPRTGDDRLAKAVGLTFAEVLIGLVSPSVTVVAESAADYSAPK